jgi:hypothetical protein
VRRPRSTPRYGLSLSQRSATQGSKCYLNKSHSSLYFYSLSTLPLCLHSHTIVYLIKLHTIYSKSVLNTRSNHLKEVNTSTPRTYPRSGHAGLRRCRWLRSHSAFCGDGCPRWDGVHAWSLNEGSCEAWNTDASCGRLKLEARRAFPCTGRDDAHVSRAHPALGQVHLKQGHGSSRSGTGTAHSHSVSRGYGSL